MIYLEKVFNFTLRSNEVRLDIEARCANPPAPMLQAMGLSKERIARNVMEGFLFGVFLLGVFAWVFPQFPLDRGVFAGCFCLGFLLGCFLNFLNFPRYTEMNVIYPIHLTEPQGIIKNCLD